LVTLLCGSCTAAKVLTHAANNDPVELPSGTYQLDPRHWNVTFDVDHFGYSRFVMRFDRADATLDFNSSEPEASKLNVAIDATSLDTNVAELDQLVMSDTLLETEQFPKITFTARELHRTAKNVGTMIGDLTIRGRTRPVTIAVTFNGGASTHIDRASFGLNKWYPAVGNDIHVSIQAEFIKHAAK
jgi:polyisoprenoid-binding protein YceI